MSARTLFAFLLAAVLLTVGTCSAQDSRGLSTDETATFVLRALRRNHSLLRSGSFRASGKFSSEHASGQITGNVQLFSAFDLDQKLIRFDRTSPELRLPPKGDLRAATVVQAAQKYLRSNGQQVLWQDLLPIARVVPFAADGHTQSGYFDVRLLGLIDRDRLLMNSFTFDSGVHVIDFKPQSAQSDGPKLYRLTWELPADRWVIIFNENQGMCPVSMESFLFIESTGLYRDEPLNRTVLSWMKVAGVWVLKSVLHERSGLSPMTESFELTWKNVNEPLDPKYFELPGLELPPGAKVVGEIGGGVTSPERANQNIDAIR